MTSKSIVFIRDNVIHALKRAINDLTHNAIVCQ